jgi:hypothetical protein
MQKAKVLDSDAALPVPVAEVFECTAGQEDFALAREQAYFQGHLST